MDKDKVVFDDRMYTYLKQVSFDSNLVDDVVKHCDSLGYCQSKRSYAQIKKQVKTFQAVHASYGGWRDTFKASKSRLIDEFKQMNLKMVNYFSKEDIVHYLPKKETHAGFSFIETGLRKKGEYIDKLFQMYTDEEKKAKSKGSFNKPILIGVRTQCAPPFDVKDGKRKMKLKFKTRLVSICDIFQVMAELKFAKPLQDFCARKEWYAGGKNDSNIWAIIHRNTLLYREWVTLDYSSYDQTIPGWLIYEAFDVIEAAFCNDADFDHELWAIVKKDFVEKTFITADGEESCTDGVGSGFAFTSLMDTVVNLLMIGQYMESKGIKDWKCIIMGDDNLIFTKIPLDLKDVSTFLEYNFGVIMNQDKCAFGKCGYDDPEFLSRFWTERGPYRRPEILISKLLYPESFREYDRLGFTPGMVLSSYIDAYRTAMQQWIDVKRLDLLIREERKTAGKGNWLSGYDAYRKNYLEK